jgi:hypothetical protein
MTRVSNSKREEGENDCKHTCNETPARGESKVCKEQEGVEESRASWRGEEGK